MHKIASLIIIILMAGTYTGCTDIASVDRDKIPSETQNPPDAKTPDPKADAGPADAEVVDNDTITFEVPEEWKLFDEVENKGLSHWSGYIPDPLESVTPAEAKLDEREQQHMWKFTLVELEENNIDDAVNGYQELSSSTCIPDDNCSMSPVKVEERFGVTTHSIEKVSKNEAIIFAGEFYKVFFEKDGRIFEIGVRGDLEDPIMQETVDKVLSTLTITEN
jgi:hypothetical protein